MATLSVAITPSLALATEYARVWASAPHSAGAQANQRMYLMRVVIGNPLTPLASVDITSQWVARFGNLVVGQRIQIGVEVTNNKGMVSKQLVASKVVS